MSALKVHSIFAKFAITVLLATLFSSVAYSTDISSTERSFPLIGHSNTAWVRKYENRYIMFIRGSHYEMGYQHGAMLPAEVRKTLTAYINSVPETLDELLYVYSCGEPYIPQEYKDEMRGLADGSGIDINLVHAAHAIPTLHHCSGFAVWGPATKDGKVYHTRSLDYGVTIADPHSGETVQMHSTVILRKPSKGYASLIPAWAGFIGSVDGMNEKKISIGEMGQGTDDYTYRGLFMIFRLRYTLENAKNMKEAIHYMSLDRECGYSFIVADGNTNEAQMIEQTWHHYYNGSWDNIEEANGYSVMHYQIPYAVRRGNHMIAYSTAMTQRDVYLMLPTDGDFLHLINYLILSEKIEKNYGNIDFDKAQEIFVEAYRKYPFQFTLHQVVFSPADLKMRVGDAYPEGTGAFWNTFYEYSLPDVMSLPEILNISQPLNGTTVSGTIVVKPKILQGYKPNIVKLYVDGVEVANTTQPPYEITFNTASVPNGPHSLEIRAYGTNFSAIAYVTVRVSNPFYSHTRIHRDYWKFEKNDVKEFKDASKIINNIRIPKIALNFEIGKSDWIVTGTYYLNDTTKFVDGKVIIENGGKLFMKNSTLIINSSKDGENGLIVKDGGYLELVNSTLKNHTRRIFVYAFSGAKGIKAISSCIRGGGFSVDRPLVYIACDNVLFINSTIIHNGYGLIINGENTLYNVKVTNTNFKVEDVVHLPIRDIYTPRGASLFIGNVERGLFENIRIKGIDNGKLFSFGVLIADSRECTVRKVIVENEYVGIGLLSSRNNLVSDFEVYDSNMGGGFLLGSMYNVFENGRVERCAGGIGNVYNSPYNRVRNVYINDTNIAIGAQESIGVVFENININNTGGVMFDKAEKFVLRNSTIRAKYCGVIIKSRCHGSILENITISLEKDMYGIGAGRSKDLVLRNIRLKGARYAVHIEGNTPEEYKWLVENFTTEHGAVSYYWGVVPKNLSGGQILIGGISNVEINVTTTHSPIYLFCSENVTIRVKCKNVVNGLVIYHSKKIKVYGNIENSSTYGLMLYRVYDVTADLNVNGSCWAYAVHHSEEINIRGTVDRIKDSLVYSIFSRATIEASPSRSTYGVISRFSEIFFVKEMPKSNYYYHIHNSTVYICNYLHVYVYAADGTPLHGATVNVSFNDRLIATKKTDSNGYVKIVAPYAIWQSGQIISNYTVVEVYMPGVQFGNNPRIVDMSQERTEIFKEISLVEIYPMILILLFLALFIVRRKLV